MTPDPPRSLPPLDYVGPAMKAAFEGWEEIDTEFHDVVARVFPLRANINRLESFVDSYLNADVPPKIACFRPVAPYVLMMVLNYGRMTQAATNSAWVVSQNEILFAVPLFGRWNDHGQMVSGFNLVSPFIFVDNDWSITGGREVLGWPKVPAWLEPSLSSWTRDPRSRRRLLTLNALTFSKLYRRERVRPRMVLAIDQEVPKYAQYPLSTGYLLSPFLELPKAAADALSSVPDFLRGFAHLRGLRQGSGLSLPGLLQRAFGVLTRGGGPQFAETVNLKQFRASTPSAACFQSLVGARMEVRRFNGGGLMGSVEQLRGDPTGGFSIWLPRSDSLPVVESLGLYTEGAYDTQDGVVDLLRPMLPVWGSFDLRYGGPSRICWRTEKGSAPDRGWQAWKGFGAGTTPLVSLTPAAGAGPADAPVPRRPREGRDLPEYNATLGPVVSPVQGPFDFYDVTMRVLPLSTRSVKLAETLPQTAATGSFRPVPGRAQEDSRQPYDSFAFLVVMTCQQMSADANDVGWWASTEVGFATVVRRRQFVGLETDRADPQWGRFFNTHWLYWPYIFSESPIAVTQGREVLGLPTTYARIRRGRDPWLEAEADDRQKRLLSLSTLDVPALGVGQRAVDRPLFEIAQRTVQSGHGEDGEVGREGTCDRSLLTELIKHLDRYEKGVRIPDLTVKEFPDEEAPSGPCYQAMLACDRRLAPRRDPSGDATPRFEVELLHGEYTVRFQRSPTHPIVQTLGLRVEPAHDDPTIQVCRATSPFKIRADLRAELPIPLLHRCQGESWLQPAYLPFSYDELTMRPQLLYLNKLRKRGFVQAPARRERADGGLPKPDSEPPGDGRPLLGRAAQARLRDLSEKVWIPNQRKLDVPHLDHVVADLSRLRLSKVLRLSEDKSLKERYCGRYRSREEDGQVATVGIGEEELPDTGVLWIEKPETRKHLDEIATYLKEIEELRGEARQLTAPDQISRVESSLGRVSAALLRKRQELPGCKLSHELFLCAFQEERGGLVLELVTAEHPATFLLDGKTLRIVLGDAELFVGDKEIPEVDDSENGKAPAD